MPIHSIWRCPNTSYTSNIDVGCNHWWYTVFLWHHNVIVRLHFISICPTFAVTLKGIAVYGYTHKLTHGKWRCPNTSYSINIDVWCSEQWFTTSTMTSLWPKNSKFRPPMHIYNCVRLYSYTHPQHVKMLKLFIYIQHGCGIQSAVVSSLFHDTMMSLCGCIWSQFSKIYPPTAQIHQF